MFGSLHLEEVVMSKPASSLVVSLGKAFNEMPLPLCGKHVAQTLRKWQLPNECGTPVQNVAMQFAFLRMEDKYGQYNCVVSFG